MQINLTNQFMSGFTGSEMWTYTMAKYLSRKHKVHVVTVTPSKLASMMDFCSVGGYMECDLALANHIHESIPLDVPMIATKHSIIPNYPSEYPDRPCIKVAPHEEIEGWEHIIRQCIDLERFKPTPVNQKPKNILYFGNPNYLEMADFVKEAFSGYNFFCLDRPMFEVENVIKLADIVVTTARGAYEALAMGKNVIIADKRPYKKEFSGSGMITKDNFEHLLKANLSGRNDQKEFTLESLRAEVDKYDPTRKIDMSRFDANLIANEYLSLWTNTKNVT